MLKKINLFLILLFSFFLITSCMTNDEDKFYLDINAPEAVEYTKSVNIEIAGNLIGMKNGRLELINEDTKEKIVKSFTKLPSNIELEIEKPGKYSVVAKAMSLLNGKEYSDYKPRLFAYDPSKPFVSEIHILPTKIFKDEEVLLHLLINTSNPEVKIETQGLERYGKSEISLETKPGDVFLNIGKFSEEGNKEFFLKIDNIMGTTYSTKVSLDVFPVDKEHPEIAIKSKFSYPSNSNIQIYLDISDDVEVSNYEVYVDGEKLASDVINDVRVSNIPVYIGKLNLGDHSLVVKATDWLGKKTTIGKRILVGDTYLNFEIAVSNETNLIPGHKTIISVIPTEEGINFRKIVYFIDGEEYMSFEGTVQNFVEWTIEEGSHYITVYAEDENGRAGINEIYITVEDNNSPKLVSLSVNDEVLNISETNKISLGVNTISAHFKDPGGISKNSTPILYIREDHYTEYYDVLEMRLSDISPDEKEATFTVTTSIGYGYFNLFIKGLKDKQGNEYQGEDIFMVVSGY